MCLFRKKYQTQGRDYSIPQFDLNVMPEGVPGRLRYLFENITVDEGAGYLGHPDSVLLKNGDLLTFFPEGHGRGKTLSRISSDGGKSYPKTIEAPPKSWEGSKETPTVYRLEFTEHPWPDRLILICGAPKWPGESSRGGFDCSLSDDEGGTWTEYESFYTRKDAETFFCIVAMSSLTKLKENGKFVDRWMGLFHESDFVNYKTVLSFDEDGKMRWSRPEPYFSAWRGIEKGSRMCEVECVRSERGRGDELMLLTRSNSKKMNSLVSFSRDEGKSWSRPGELPSALNGERHKAEYLPDGRLFITFRSIERDGRKNRLYSEKPGRGWYSEGWVAWVGSYEDIKNGREGDYRLKLAHTYLDGQTEPCVAANADTGYCGNAILPDGTVVSASYGVFSPEKTYAGGKKRKTYVVSRRIRIEDVETAFRNRLRRC